MKSGILLLGAEHHRKGSEAVTFCILKDSIPSFHGITSDGAHQQHL